MLGILFWLVYVGIGVGIWFGAKWLVGEERPVAALCYAFWAVGTFYYLAWIAWVRLHTEVAPVVGWGFVLAPLLLLAAIVAGVTALVTGEKGAGWALALPLALGGALLGGFVLFWIYGPR